MIVIHQPLPWVEFILHNSYIVIELVVCIRTFYKRHPPSFECILITLCCISYLNGGSGPPWRNSFEYITTFASRKIHLICIWYRIKTQRSLRKPCWPFHMWLSASQSHRLRILGTTAHGIIFLCTDYGVNVYNFKSHLSVFSKIRDHRKHDHTVSWT